MLRRHVIPRGLLEDGPAYAAWLAAHSGSPRYCRLVAEDQVVGWVLIEIEVEL